MAYRTCTDTVPRADFHSIPSMSSIEPFPVTVSQLYTCQEDVPTDTILRQIFAKVIAEDETSFQEIRELISDSNPEQVQVGQAGDNDASETPASIRFTVNLATQEGANYDSKVTAVTYVFSDSSQIAGSDSKDTDESSEEDANSQGDASGDGEPAVEDPMDVGAD
jgi:hypothetical protein